MSSYRLQDVHREVGVGADTESQIRWLHPRRGRQRRLARLGSLDRVLHYFVACELLRVPATVADDRGAVSDRLRSCSSRRVLSGDILVASGVQRTAVQRPPTLRLIRRVTQGDCVHTRVNWVVQYRLYAVLK